MWRITELLKPDRKILFDLQPGAFDYQPEEEEINRQQHARICSDLLPGYLHIGTPMNIVKYQYRRLRAMARQSLEISQRRIAPVVAVHKRQFDRRNPFQQISQLVIKATCHH